MRPVIDLSGRKFFRLLVLERSDNRGTGRKVKIFWKCLCDCGNICVVGSSELKRGRQKSCGCQRSYRFRTTSEQEVAKHAAVHDYARAAKRRHIEWNLSFEQAIHIMQATCVYCGSLPDKVRKGDSLLSQDFEHNGIDRVNNNIGYLIDNCVPCCKICNHAKSNLPVDEFLEWAERVVAYSVTSKFSTEAA